MATIKQNIPHAHTRILGIGAYRPSEIVTNDDVCQWIDSSDEWIVKRTGIHTRHRAPADVSVLDMAAVSYTHLTLPTNSVWCRSRWSPYH